MKTSSSVVYVTGPTKLVEDVLSELMEFMHHIPLIYICCNPGLKERHWEMISAHVSFSISPDKDVPFKKLIDADSIKVL